MNRFQISENEPSKNLRDLYLNSLSEPQNFFLESLVGSGKTWEWDNQAYAVVFENTLIEFYVAKSHSHLLLELYDEIVASAGITKIFCKSFDTQLLFAALSNHKEVSTLGFMFRRNDNKPFQKNDLISDRLGTIDDIESILKINDDFFESKDEIASYIESNNLFIFESAGEIIGCGIASIVNPGRKNIDIGMLVSPNERNLGYGAYIVSYMKDHFQMKGYRPICGCSADNVASQKTLAKAGFVSEHRILQIDLKNQ